MLGVMVWSMAKDDVPTVKIETLKPVRAVEWNPTVLDEAVHRRGDVVHVELVRDEETNSRFVLSLSRRKARLLALLLDRHASRMPVVEYDTTSKEFKETATLIRLTEDHVTTKRYDCISQDAHGGATYHDEYETWDDATSHALHVKGLDAWKDDRVYVRDHSTTPSKRFEIDESGQCKEVTT